MAGPAELSSARVEVADAAEAAELFLQRGWTDGLPIVVPTPDLVSAFVSATGSAPTAVLGELPEQNRSLTVEKLAVNAVMAGCRPEYMSTPATEAVLADPERRAWLISKLLVGRAGQPADIASAVLYLASDESSFMTGQTLVVDGGRLIS